ncbi:MAG TPA: 23S rRNA (guanosine(2251)-2'-O)-methyltransferase RlmB [Micromonosporaceae bacterium]|jgi:23S rRNA (guanosine2251-2'-O)-methyltransferase
MPGNSQRRGRRTTAKKGSAVGSGGRNRAGLSGRGRTLPAEERPWHKGYSGEEVPAGTARKQERERRAAAATGRTPKVGTPGTALRGAARGATAGRPRVSPGRRAAAPKTSTELVVGRNPVLEALRTHTPTTALFVAIGIDADERMAEIVRTATDRGVPLLEISRAELDRMTGGVLHQGVGLQVPPFAYEPFEDLLAAAGEAPNPLLVALDGVTDPRNLGAVVRSAAAFGAQGVFLPERRAAGMTATAWRTSAGAAARLPISQVTNLTRSLVSCKEAGFTIVGLDADGATDLYALDAALSPLVVVVGSEGRGLSRLVGATCDLRVSIPISSTVDSLNASVAAAIALAEVARRRTVR